MKRAGTVLAATVALAVLAGTMSGCGLLLKKSYKVGDTVSGAKIDLKVTGVRFAREVTGFFPKVPQPKDGYLWAFVDMQVTNTQKASVDPFTGFVVYLTTKDGKRAQSGPTIMANGPEDFHNLGSVQALDAGESATGSVPFYVKEGAELGTLRLSSFDVNKKDVTVALAGIIAKADKEGVVPLGNEAIADGVGMTVHGTRKSAKYSYKSGILTNSLTPQSGNVFLEIDVSFRNVSREPTLTVSDDIMGNQIVHFAPDSARAGKLFLMTADGKWADPMGSIGLFREEMMPKPLWWKVAAQKKGETQRAWVVFNVPDTGGYQLELRMPRLGPPLRFALE